MPTMMQALKGYMMNQVIIQLYMRIIGTFLSGS